MVNTSWSPSNAVIVVPLRSRARGRGLGPLVLGICLLLAHLAYRPRLFIPGVFITLLAAADLLSRTMAASGLRSGGLSTGLSLCAAAIGVGAVAIAGRQRYVGVGAYPLSPAALLATIGILLLGMAGGAAVRPVYGAILSLWLLATVLTLLGLVNPARPVRLSEE